MLNAAKIAKNIMGGGAITPGQALALFDCGKIELFNGANSIREHFKGNRVKLCGIINAKSGSCSENCAFCAQSLRHKAKIEKYPLVDGKAVSEALGDAQKSGVACFGIVTSGNALSDKELEQICLFVSENKKRGIKISASVGALGYEALAKLKKAGLKRFHHNIETAESYFPGVCSSHTFADRLATARAVKAAGLELCCGGIFGLGESRAQRVEFGMALRALDPDSIPLNFLNPIEGTPFSSKEPLGADEILKSIAVMRYILPDKDINVCGGREVNLRDLQSWIFFAGASGLMTGNYLTTPGRGAAQDIKMIQDLGFTVDREGKR